MAETKQLRASGSTNTKKLAGSIISHIEEGSDVEIRAVGASAVNQMYKALAIASGKVATKGKSLLIRAGFDSTSENDGKTVLIARTVVE